VPGAGSSPIWGCTHCWARCDDRIRCAKATGLRNLPLHSAAANQIWLEVVALVSKLTPWSQ
jgi:hypothetical protein